MRTFTRWIAKSLALLSTVAAAAASTELKVGDPAPRFEAKDDGGHLWKLSDRLGKKIVIVYFYPADMTGGCTKQACAYRDDRDKFDTLGAEVVGVSGDNENGHRLFKKVYNLNFTLLVDSTGGIAQKFGVPVKPGDSFSKAVDGKDEVFTTGVSAKRWTFVIGRDGKIAYKNTEVKASEDSQKMLEVVRGLAGR